MIKRDYKIIGDVKHYVEEFTKKIYYDIKRLQNETRLNRTKISKLEKLAHKPREFVRCKECQKEIEEANKHIQSLGDETM